MLTESQIAQLVALIASFMKQSGGKPAPQPLTYQQGVTAGIAQMKALIKTDIAPINTEVNS